MLDILIFCIKIKNVINITAGKKEGTEVGFSQIRETLQINNAAFEIISKINEGTKIILNFMKRKKLSLMIEIIEIKEDYTIIILDDDTYIHQAWKTRFKEKYPNIPLKCFEFANEAIDYIKNLSTEEKEKTLFLVDYELSYQPINGLEVAQQVSLPRSVLVTNHICNREIESKLCELGMQMLQKLYIPTIPISII